MYVSITNLLISSIVSVIIEIDNIMVMFMHRKHSFEIQILDWDMYFLLKKSLNVRIMPSYSHI